MIARSSKSGGQREVGSNSARIQSFSEEDPYYAAKDEITGSIRKAQSMLEDWRTQAGVNGGSSAAAKRLESQLSAELQQISFDLDDIKTTIQVVETNPTKFKVSSSQLQQRRQFLQDMSKALREIQISLQTKPTKKKTGGSSAPNRDSRNAEFVEMQKSQQQALLQQQDDQLEELAMSADRLHQTAVVINEELEDQQRMLNELDEDIDREAERMNFVMRRLSRLMKTSDTKQLCLILWLLLVCVVLFVVVVIS